MADRVERESPDEDPGLGQDLRVQRELRGISLREISEATKISVRFLEAIESDDFSILPAPVFTRGFLKEYARQLGLGADEIVDRYMLYVDRRMQAEEREEAEMAARRLGPGASFGGFEAFLLVALVVVVVAAVGFFLMSRSGLQEPPAERELNVVLPIVPEEPAAEQETESPPMNPEEASDGRIMLRVSATSDSWVTLFVDGKKVLDETLRAGDERTFEAMEAVRFATIGNAGGLLVSFDDHIIPPFGRTGQVVKNRSFDRNAIEELIGR